MHDRARKKVIKEFQEKALVVLESNPIIEEELEKEDLLVLPKKKELKITEVEEPIAFELYADQPRKTLLNDSNDSLISQEDIDFPNRIEIRSAIMGALVIRADYLDYIEDTIPEPVAEYDDLGRILPKENALLAFPNPTKISSTLKLEVADKSNFRIMLFTMQGEFLSELSNQIYERGTFEIPVDLSTKKPGTYLVVVSSKNFNETIRLVKQ